MLKILFYHLLFEMKILNVSPEMYRDLGIWGSLTKVPNVK